MGTISEKLTYLNGTKQAIKDELNRFGADLDNEDTFRSYSNVINDIYDKLPKVSGNGSDFTLESVQNGKLDLFEMYGNTEQTTYSGKNKYAITSAAGYSYSNSLPSVLSNNMVIDSYDLSNITFHTAGNQYLLVLLPTFELEPNTDYIINYTRSNNLTTGTAARRFIYEVDSSNNFSLIQQYFADEGFQAYQFTTGTTGKIAIAFGFSNNSSGSSSTVNNLMIRLATESDGTFEPYVGGISSPNPDYPQDIKVVTGDNTINVHGKNLFSLENIKNNETGRTTYTIENNNIVITVSSGGTYRYAYKQINDLIIGQEYTIKIGTHNDTSTNKIAQWGVVDSRGNYYGYVRTLSSTQQLTFTPTETFATFRAGYLGNSCSQGDILTIGNIQLEKGSTATEYQPYQSKDYEISLKSKNLFDSSLITSTTASIKYIPIQCKPNTDYTLSTNDVASPTNTNLFLSTINSGISSANNGVYLNSPRTINSGNNTIIYVGYRNDISNSWVQLEENSTATEYEEFYNYKLCKIEDYQDVIFKNNQLSEYYDSTLDEDSWYIKKEIGKVVLDGSEEWVLAQTNTDTLRFNCTNGLINGLDINTLKIISNNFVNGISTSDNSDNEHIRSAVLGYPAMVSICINKTRLSSQNVEGFKTWLSTHNTTVYYALATPTYEKITNSTLISQLESIEAFTGLNNFSVSNENNVLPTLYVSRLKELGKLE